MDIFFLFGIKLLKLCLYNTFEHAEKAKNITEFQVSKFKKVLKKLENFDSLKDILPP